MPRPLVPKRRKTSGAGKKNAPPCGGAIRGKPGFLNRAAVCRMCREPGRVQFPPFRYSWNIFLPGFSRGLEAAAIPGSTPGNPDPVSVANDPAAVSIIAGARRVRTVTVALGTIAPTIAVRPAVPVAPIVIPAPVVSLIPIVTIDARWRAMVAGVDSSIMRPGLVGDVRAASADAAGCGDADQSQGGYDGGFSIHDLSLRR